MSSFQIIQPGFYTTVQDAGRRGFAHLGVPESGAMDQEAYHLANVLLNNKPGVAVLECTLVGPQIRFEIDTAFVLTGGLTRAILDGEPVAHGVIAFAKAQQILRVGAIQSGARCYLAFAGGIESKLVLGSRSMYSPLTPFRVAKGEELPLGNSNYGNQKGARLKVLKSTAEVIKDTISEISAYKGPEYSKLSKEQEQEFLRVFTVSKHWNRMALQLEEPLINDFATMITAPVLPGTLQLTPSGTLIVLLRDCQTTGGYPRILQVSEAGLNGLSRLQKGDQFRWKLFV